MNGSRCRCQPSSELDISSIASAAACSAACSAALRFSRLASARKRCMLGAEYARRRSSVCVALSGSARSGKVWPSPRISSANLQNVVNDIFLLTTERAPASRGPQTELNGEGFVQHREESENTRPLPRSLCDDEPHGSARSEKRECRRIHEKMRRRKREGENEKAKTKGRKRKSENDRKKTSLEKARRARQKKLTGEAVGERLHDYFFKPCSHNRF